jgi:hypothetical protein
MQEMNANVGSNHAPASPDQPRHYRITIQGHLHPRWSEWFENLTITRQPDGTTSLSGPVADQAALLGLIIKVRDMGLPLLAVQSLSPDQGE